MGIEQKAAGAVGRFQNTTHGGGGCGCFATGCGIVGLLFVTMCVGSYFITMHSSLPLSLIESALEADGNIEVEGLRGNFSSGFEIDSLKFESEECDEWNELRNVRFSYNGFFNLVRTKRLIIEEASIGGATIYTNIDGNGGSQITDNIDGEEVASDFTEEWQEVQDEFQGNDSDDLKELRVDMLSARNVSIVDPQTGTKLEFKKIEFKDYQMLNGHITRLGDLEIVSDQIDLQTNKSAFYADETVAWNLTGNVKPVIHEAVIKEIPFDVDFAIVGNNKFRLHLKLFDGQVEIDEPYGDKRVFHLKDFSHAEFFEMKSRLVPSMWQVSMTIEPSEIEVEPTPTPESETESETEPETEPEAGKSAAVDPDKGEVGDDEKSPEPGDKRSSESIKVKKKINTVTIEPGSTFLLGKTRFDINTGNVVFGPDEKMEPPFIVAQGQLEGTTVNALITLRGGPPYFAVALDADGIETRDLWARLFFEKEYDTLQDDQQKEVDTAMHAADPVSAFDESKPVDF